MEKSTLDNDKDNFDLTLFDDRRSTKDELILCNDTIINDTEGTVYPVHSSSPVNVKLSTSVNNTNAENKNYGDSSEKNIELSKSSSNDDTAKVSFFNKTSNPEKVDVYAQDVKNEFQVRKPTYANAAKDATDISKTEVQPDANPNLKEQLLRESLYTDKGDQDETFREITDLQTQYKYVNKIYVLKNSKNYNVILNLINELPCRITTYEQTLSKFVENISGRVMGNELKLSHKEKNKANFEMKIRKKVEGLMNKVDNLTAFEQKGNRLKEEIKEANKKIDKANVDLKHLENMLKEIPNNMYSWRENAGHYKIVEGDETDPHYKENNCTCRCKPYTRRRTR